MGFYKCFLVMVLLLIPAILFAGITGKIVGNVIDSETGDALIGVNVIVEGTFRGAATDIDGNYLILNVQPGIYNVTFSMVGYNSVTIEKVSVSVDRTTHQNVEMTSEVIQGEVVTLVASRPVIKMDVTSTEVNVGAQTIEAIPVENFGDVVQLQAGVVDGHFRGGRSSEVAYMVDGVILSDPYSSADPFSRTTSNQVENAAIEEVQVIAGTFNAEYGQAMSGIVNIVTKEGDKAEYHGNLGLATGDYVSSRSIEVGQYSGDEKNYLDQFNLSHLQDYSYSLSGPVPYSSGRLTFYTTGRFLFDNGRLYGQRVFLPTDSSNFISNNPAEWYMEQSGDNEIMTLDPFEKLSGQFKLTWFASPTIKLSYNLMRDWMEYKNLDNRADDGTEDMRLFKYNPDGLYTRYGNGITNIFGLNHVLGPKTFYTASLSFSQNTKEYYVYEDPYDSRYVNPDRLEDAQNFAFYTGGTGMWNHWRRTSKAGLKLDVTHQLNKVHQFKTGFDLAQYQMELEEYKLIWDDELDSQVIIKDSFYYNKYHAREAESPLGGFPFNDEGHHPTSFAMYLQDKMEYEEMVLNFGVRVDYFHPDALVPDDLEDPGNDSLTVFNYATETEVSGLDPVTPFNDDGSPNYWRYKYHQADAHVQVSPRIGIAFPLTATGVIHFSYGHFFQTPPFQYLYYNPDFEVSSGGLESIIGNAELKPEKTVMYEIGFKQEIAPDVGINITGFYKDIRNLLGTEILIRYDQSKYARYVNRDYGNVRGITAAIERRFTGGFGMNIDYTFQVAEGNSSDPRDVFDDNQADPPRESEKKLRPLDWDQAHTLNGTLYFGDPGNWNIGLIGRIGSGLPYTSNPYLQPEGEENDSRKPVRYNLDVKATKSFMLSKFRATLTLWIYNLFDTENETDVYADTGRATYTLESQQLANVRGYNTLSDYFTRPDYFNAPRQVKLGLSIGF